MIGSSTFHLVAWKTLCLLLVKALLLVTEHPKILSISRYISWSNNSSYVSLQSINLGHLRGTFQMEPEQGLQSPDHVNST